MAQAYNLPVSTHDCTGPLTLYAGIHLNAALPNCVLQETVRAHIHTVYPKLIDEVQQVADGHVALPARPRRVHQRGVLRPEARVVSGELAVTAGETGRPPDLRATLALRCGEATLRCLRDDDAEPLGAYFARLSTRTRDFYGPHRFDRETADRLCRETRTDTEVVRFVVTVIDGDGARIIVGFRMQESDTKWDHGLEAARLLVGRLKGTLTSRMAAVFPPVAISIDKQCTDQPPLGVLVERIEAIRARPEILAASLWLGFPYADVAEMGSAVTVVSDGDALAAEQAAGEIARALWDMRAELQVDLHGEPLAIEGRVLDVFDGRFHEPEARHGGVHHYDQGRTAVVESTTGRWMRVIRLRACMVWCSRLDRAGTSAEVRVEGLQRSAGTLIRVEQLGVQVGQRAVRLELTPGPHQGRRR